MDFDADQIRRDFELRREGKLSGKLIGIKDLIDTAGRRTTYGSPIYADHVPSTNAPIVDLLLEQGAVIAGKTALNEFAYGVSGLNPHYGVILSPRDRSRTAGGSSGGSAAAVAAGMCHIAVGTDTSGSIRVPAACCGVYGYKAAAGAYSMKGIMPLAESYDSLGFFTSCVEDLQLLLDIDGLPPWEDLRLARIGHDLEVPILPQSHWDIFRAEVWSVHRDRVETSAQLYGRDLLWKLDLPFGDLEHARRDLDVWQRRFEQAVAGVDVLAGPVFDGSAPLLASAHSDYDNDEFLIGDRLLRCTPTYNQLGWPAMVAPTADGPIHLAARPGDEAKLLRAAKELGLEAAEVVVGGPLP